MRATILQPARRVVAARIENARSTERYDRDGKFRAYKQIPSLEEDVLVSHDPGRIEVYRRADGDWTCEVADAGGSVTIHGAAVAVDAVYG